MHNLLLIRENASTIYVFLDTNLSQKIKHGKIYYLLPLGKQISEPTALVQNSLMCTLLLKLLYREKGKKQQDSLDSPPSKLMHFTLAQISEIQ